MQPQAQQLLQHYLAANPQRLQQLRVFAVTEQASAHATASQPMQQGKAGSASDLHHQQQQQQQENPIASSSCQSSSSTKATEVGFQQPPSAVTVGEAEASTEAQTSCQHHAAVQQEAATAADTDTPQIWAELRLQGLPVAAYKAAAAAAAAAQAGSATNQTEAASAWQPSSSSISSSWWFMRRERDLAQQLLQHGLARLMPPEDFEWLVVRAAAVKAYYRCAWAPQCSIAGVVVGFQLLEDPEFAAGKSCPQLPGRS